MKLFSVSPQSLVSEPLDRNRIQTLKHGKSSKPESPWSFKNTEEGACLVYQMETSEHKHTLFCVCFYVLWICPLGSWLRLVSSCS